jgi:Flp pilus assembly pilin Flp
MRRGIDHNPVFGRNGHSHAPGSTCRNIVKRIFEQLLNSSGFLPVVASYTGPRRSLPATFIPPSGPPGILFSTAVIHPQGAFAMRQAKASVRGQGMTEYIIIVALIAVAAIAVYQFFGQTIRSQMSAIANEVGGNSGATAMKAAADAAKKTNDEQAAKGLAAYADGADKAK